MLTRSMSFAEAFPDDILREIRSYPGNDRCCDCPSLDTDWCSISHGTLICLVCAGKHRSLGVQVSFVRSISMDSWSKQQVEMVRQGGNEQIKRFFRKLEIETLPIQQLYCSKGANHYRERLKERVTKILAGEIQPEPRNLRSGHHQSRRNARSQSAITEIMGRDSTDGGHSKQKPSVQFYNVSFGDGPMGMTISKDFGGRALVSRLVAGGAAEASGVKVGDHLSGVAKKRMDSYDDIMHMIPCMKRPLVIQFTRTAVPPHGQHAHPHVSPRALSGHHGSVGIGAEPVTASPGKNRSIHGSKSMANLSLNLNGVSAEKAIVNGYHKPKIRSPRNNSNGWERSLERPEEDTTEDASGQFRSPSGLTKLKSFRSRSKDGMEGTDWREALGVAVPIEEPAPALTLSGAESTLTDERHTPATAASPFPSVTRSNGHHTTDTPLQVPSQVASQSETPSIVLSTSNDDSCCQSAAGEVSPLTRAMSVQSEPILSKTDIYREIDQLLADGMPSLSPVDGARSSETFLGAEGSPEGKNLDQHKHVLMGTEGSSKKLTLQVGTPLKVLRNDRWRSASMRRMHRDGSFKVVYRDGSSEARVSVDRIALTVDTVRALSDWQDCTAALEAEMTASRSFTNVSANSSGRGNGLGQGSGADSTPEQGNQSDERIEAAFRAASMDDSTANSYTYSDAEALSSPDTSSYRLLGHQSRSQSQQVHSFRTDDLRSTESFVVEAGENLNKWIESEAVECVVESGRDRLSSVDSVLSSGGGEGIGSFYSSREEYEILEAVYDQAPLGLRISSSRGSGVSSKSTSPAPLSMVGGGVCPLGEREVRPPDVTKVVVGGRSDLQGIQVGDELVSIDGRQVLDYYDAMAVLQSASYPLRLQFRRKNASLGAAVAKSSMVLMNTLLDKMGLQKPSIPLAQSPPLSKRTATKRLSVPVLPPSILITSPEQSPHRGTPATQFTGSSSVSAGDSQVSPTQISPFPLLDRKGSASFPEPPPVGADGELHDVELS